MSAVEEIAAELGIGEASASPAPRLFPRKEKQAPYPWTHDVRVLMIEDDQRTARWIDTMLDYVTKRAEADLDTYLCVDTETCPESAIRKAHDKLAGEVQAAEAVFKAFPMPQKIKDPEERARRDAA